MPCCEILINRYILSVHLSFFSTALLKIIFIASTACFSVGLYIAGLNGVMPGIKEWVPGQVQPGFETHQFEIAWSNLADRSQHRVAITYFTGVLSLLESFGDQLLLATGDMTRLAAGEWTDSFMLRINPMITICQYSPIRAGIGLHTLPN